MNKEAFGEEAFVPVATVASVASVARVALVIAIVVAFVVEILALVVIFVAVVLFVLSVVLFKSIPITCCDMQVPIKKQTKKISLVEENDEAMNGNLFC